MKLKELQFLATESLKEYYPKEEIGSFFSLLAEAYLRYSRFQVSINREEELSKETIIKFKDAIKRLQSFEPIQYIIGETEFFGLPFRVTKDTLIPRPETEELVALIISNYSSNSSQIKILDIGTGSGAIAISLAKMLPNAKISAIDISTEALKIAKQNAVLNAVEIQYIQNDILGINDLQDSFDVIVSNPPYVRSLEKKEMKNNVLEFEPAKALFVSDEDPLVFYKKISKLAQKHLKPQGFLFFEINEYLGVEMKSLLIKDGFNNVTICKDIFNKNRFAKCQK